jgi:hypothetical protein
VTDIFLSQRPSLMRPTKDVMLFSPTAADQATFSEAITAGMSATLTDAPTVDMPGSLQVDTHPAITESGLLTIQAALTAAVVAALTESGVLTMQGTLTATAATSMAETGLLTIASSLTAAITAALARTAGLVIESSGAFNASPALTETGLRDSNPSLTVPISGGYAATVTCNITTVRAMAASVAFAGGGNSTNTYNEALVAAMTAALTVTVTRDGFPAFTFGVGAGQTVHADYVFAGQLTTLVNTSFAAVVDGVLNASRDLMVTSGMTAEGFIEFTQIAAWASAVAVAAALREVAPFFVAMEMSASKDARTTAVATENRVMKA